MAFDGDDSSGRGAENGMQGLMGMLTGFLRRRVRDQQDVPDLMQDVYVRLSSRNNDGGEKIVDFKRYMFRTASSVLTDRHRRDTARHRDAHVAFELELHDTAEVSPEHILAERQALGNVLASLESLPARTRSIFVLHRIEGWPYREIASELGVSLKAVEKHMSRAIRHVSAVRETL